MRDGSYYEGQWLNDEIQVLPSLTARLTICVHRVGAEILLV
jgi:hypothetical protein